MFLDLLIEVILFAVILGGLLLGYRRGFFRLVGGWARRVFCFVLSLSLCDWVSNYLKPMIYNPISSLLYDSLKQGIDGLLSGIDGTVPAFSDMAWLAPDESALTDRIDAMSDSIADSLSTLISRALGFVILLILSGLLIKLLVYLADSILNIGPLGIINRLLGATVSMLGAVLIAGMLASATEYLFALECFNNSRLVAEFDGGQLYRILKLIF